MRQTTPDVLAGLATAGDAMEAAMGPQVLSLEISLVRLDGGTQPRAGIDQAVVADYASDMGATGAEFPPVQVIYDGQDYWLWDGFHRLHARQRNGLHTVPALVRQGTRRDAVLLSVGANATHGFRRSAEDKRRAVDTLLRDEEWAAWSDREIARRVGVDHKTVGARRAALSGEIPQIETRRVERGGTEYIQQPAQRGAGAAVAAQGNREMTLDEIATAVQEWSGAFEDGLEAVGRLIEDINRGGGEMLDDWQNSMATTRQTTLLLRTAALGLLTRMQRTAEVRRLKALEDERAAQEQRAQDLLAQMTSAAPAERPLTPWTAEELEEELLGLEGVSLAGADEDWLYDYVTDQVKRKGHSITRAVFDVAMLLATPRQVAAMQREDRLARAMAAAQAADAERRPVVYGRTLEIEVRRPGGQSGKQRVEVYGRNDSGVLSVKVFLDEVRLYSPGMAIDPADALRLLEAVGEAMREVGHGE